MTARQKTNRKPISSTVRKGRLARKQKQALNYETLERRELLAAITVSNASDILSPTADTSSIAALVANDGGDGISLREAITAANNTADEDAITFDGSVFIGGEDSLIRLTLGELEINDSLIIDGSTVGGVVVTGDADGDDITLPLTHVTDVIASFDGVAGASSDLLDDNSRVLDFSGQGDLSLTGLTITGGRTTATNAEGGGIRSGSDGTLWLDQTVVSGNSTTESSGGGISSFSGDVSLVNSTVSGNTTSGVFSSGGGINNFSGNLFLLDSTVSGNSTAGFLSEGGGIFSSTGDVSLTNSTVSGNGSSSNGGGVRAGSGSLLLTNSTVTGNSAADEGGGLTFNFDSDDFVTLQNSIVASNLDNGTAPDILGNGNMADDLIVENSLIGDTTGSTIDVTTGTGNILNQLPLLGSLADNGGPTQTHALLTNSPAVNAGSNAIANAAGLTTDQRGEDRINFGTVDIGAFEAEIEVRIIVTTNLDVVDQTDGVVSLREAIVRANAEVETDTIRFDPNVFNAGTTITILSPLPTITDVLRITGPGANLLAIDAQGGGDGVFDGNGFRIFEVNDGDSNNSVDVFISGLTLTGGDNNDSGGAINNFENLSLDSVSIIGNRARFGGGVSNELSGVLTLTNSTIANNEASQDGGGIFNRGDLTATSVTVSGNSAADNGGAIVTSGDSSGATLNLIQSTLTNNTADDGVHFSNAYGPTNATFNNTIIDSSITGVGNNGSTLAGSNNLFASSDPSITGTSNLFNQMSNLGPLADNGGPTLTHTLLYGSPAFNNGSIALALDGNGNLLQTDQRGELRVQFGAIDIGAVETEIEATGSLIVTTTQDVVIPGDGFTSLREAIAFANDPTAGVNGDGDADGDGLASDTITFDASVFTGGDNNLIRLTLGELTISNGLTIDGIPVGGVVITGDANDDDVTLPGTHITDLAASFGGTIGAADDLLDDNSRVLNIYNARFNTSGDVTLTGLTITGGRVTDVSEGGGGIKFDSFADLTLNQVTVSGNSAANPNGIVGYGVTGGGGIVAPNGDLYLTSSIVTGNSTGSLGGGIRGGNVHLTDSTVTGNYSGRNGGGIRGGSVSLTNSTVSGNTSSGSGGGISSAGDVTLTNSTVSENSSAFLGGGIYSGSGDVTLNNSTVSNNGTVDSGGNFRGGGGIAVSSGDVLLNNSTVSGNSTAGDGGGIYALFGNVSVNSSTVSGNNGAGIHNERGNVVLNNSTVNENIGRGIFASSSGSSTSLFNSTVSGNSGGGILTFGGDVFLTNSTVSGNSSPIDGGGISAGEVSLTNSTVSGNSSVGDGGGIFVEEGDVVSINSTVTDNSASGAGGGIVFNTRDRIAQTLTLSNSIVAGNTDDGTAPDLLAGGDRVTNELDVEHSLIGDTTGSGFTASTGTGNILNQIALLGPLANNGGLTQTHALLPGSPAIDAGDDALAVVANGTLATDQRGGVFIRLFDDPTAPGTGVDIGAFELHALSVDNPIDEDDGNVSVGDLSLREAVRLANDSPLLNTITFDGAVFTGGDNSVIRLTQGELVISERVTIDATLATDVVITGDANDDDVTFPGTAITDVLASFGGIDGAADDLLDDNSRVLNFSDSTGDLMLVDLTVTGGQVAGRSVYGGGVLFGSSGALILNQAAVSGNGTSGYLGNGGGIFTDSGNIYLNDSSVSENNTRGDRGRGGGIYARSGIVSLNDSTVSGNSTSSSGSGGGGIFNTVGNTLLINSTVSGNSTAGMIGRGGGIGSASGDVSLIDSTVSGNSTAGERAYGGGIYTRNGDISLLGSTVSANSTAGSEGRGGGIYSYDGTVSLTNSTVSGNNTTGIGSNGGGIYTNQSSVVVVNSTVANNSSSGVGGGIGLFVNDFTTNESLTLQNSIVADNTDNGTAPDVLAPDDVSNDLIVEHSLIGDTTGSGINASPGTTNILNQSALLGPLAENGGATLTHALLPGSPALDVGSNELAVDENGNLLVTDQRGEIRVVGAVDIGAVETPFDGVRSLVVTTNQDVVDSSDGVTSLREAISFTNLIFSSDGASDTITFDASVFTGGDSSLIRLTQGELSISDSLIIDGSSVGGVVITGDADGDDATVVGTDITDVSASFGQSAGDVDDLLDDNSRVINFSNEEGNLTLTGLSLTGGRTMENNDRSETTYSGGGIRFASSGRLVLSVVAVSGNSTSGGRSHGGGIFSSLGNISLTNSTVSGNSITNYLSNGGGIYTTTGDVSLNNSIVSGNSAASEFNTSSGGGISTGAGDVSLINSVVSGNSASDDGGGIRAFYGNVYLSNNSSVSENVSGDLGGGIFTSSGDVTLTNSAVNGNNASDDGGGISTSSGNVTLNDSIVNGNSTAADGGGIYTSSGDVTLNSSTVNGSNVSGDGGGINTRLGNVSLINSTVSGNSSVGDGGGIRAYQGYVSLTNSTVSENRTTGLFSNGGGIHTREGNVTLDNSTASGNSTLGDGGGIRSQGGDISLVNSTLSGNTAGRGGGLYGTGSTIDLINSTFSGNTASGKGGGIYIFANNIFSTAGATILSLINSSFVGNSSDVGGGISLGGDVFGALNTSVNLTIANSILADNIDNGGTPDLDASSNFVNDLVIEHSLIGSTSGSNISATTGTGNILNQAALLGPLADNGGPTLTHALLPGSPAIDAGSNALALDENGNPLTTDQRGEDRIQDGTVNIGAVEFEKPFLLGDVNLDGDVSFLDISPFISLLSGNDFLNEADINRDGTVNFLDISPFITLLANGGGSTAPVLLGDANQDGAVNFLDISPFISLLSNDTFLDQADINRDGSVNFLDISPFISILSTGGSVQSNLVAVDSDEASVSQDFVATTEATVVPPVSSAVSVVSGPASIVSVASTVDVTIIESPLIKISADTPTAVSPAIALETSQPPLVLVSESLASPAFEANQLPVKDAEVVGATPVDIYNGPVVFVTARDRIFGGRDSSLRVSESDGPLVTRRSLKGSAESLDFSSKSREQHSSTDVSTEESFLSAAELFDAHPESLDEVFDFEFEEAVAGLLD